MQTYYMGIEIGATKQQIAVGDNEGKIDRIISEKIKIDKGAKSILAWLKKNVSRLIDYYNNKESEIIGICVGFGGIVESKSGKVILSVQVKGWENFNLKSWFEDTFKIQTLIINDTVAGGYGELIIGAGKDSKNFFYSNIGSGIGGALFINREYYDGSGYGAAYLGHTYIPDWHTNICGKEIKVENICSGFAIEKRLRTKGYVPQESLLWKMCCGNVQELSCRMLGDAAMQNDAFATEEVKRVANSYALGLSNLITITSPDTITIGGGVANIGDILIQSITEYSRKYAFESTKDKFRITLSKLKDNVVNIGAILYASHVSK